jgi:hypothetical protein
MVDCYVAINSVVLSDFGNEITVEDTREEKDFTAFGATSKVVGKGLGDANITIKLFQSFTAAKTHQTLKALIGSVTPFPVEVRPTSAVRSATNPAALLAGALLFTYNFLDGGIGDVSEITAVFKNASQAGMTYPEA